MSQKRKRNDEVGEAVDNQDSSKKQRSNIKTGGPRFKGQRRPKSEPKPNATNGIKSRIRDLKRLLEHVDNEPKYRMPAGVRVERERELETLEHELNEKSSAARDQALKNKMISKYHQVRFFDRRKADRVLKRLNRQLSNLEDRSKRPELLQKIHNAEVDLNYAMYHPLLEPYSSLYPNTKRDKGEAEESTKAIGTPEAQNTGTDGPKGNHEMWAAVEEAMENGTLEALRNRKPGGVSKAVVDKKTGDKKKKKDKKSKGSIAAEMLNSTKNATGEEEGEESDGWFFE